MTSPSPRWQAIARTGKSSWWRCLLGIVIFGGFTQILGGIAAVAFAIAAWGLQGRSAASLFQETTGGLFTEPSLINFIALNLPFIIGIAGLWLVIHFLHHRPFLSLMGIGKLHWHLFGSALGIWAILVACVSALSYASTPDEFALTFRLGQWLPLLAATIPLTFLQVSCEELFFRGYLLQELGLVIRSKALLAAVAAVPFAAAHFANPEMDRGAGWMAFYYFAFGWFTCWITLKSDRLEPALGFHLANNYFGILILSSTDSVLPTPAIFTANSEAGNPMALVLMFLVQTSIFYLLFFKLLPWQQKQAETESGQ